MRFSRCGECDQGVPAFRIEESDTVCALGANAGLRRGVAAVQVWAQVDPTAPLLPVWLWLRRRQRHHLVERVPVIKMLAYVLMAIDRLHGPDRDIEPLCHQPRSLRA
jgi:hypothetical protein